MHLYSIERHMTALLRKLPMDESFLEWPSGEQVLSYLKGYASKHCLAKLFCFGTSVLSIDERTNGKAGWTLDLCSRDEEGEEEHYKMDFDFIVVCTGTFVDPKLIMHPGQNDFKRAGGLVVHSSEYKDVAPDDIKGKQVIVLGGSKSATDIAVHAVEKQGAHCVTLIMRRNVWRIPRFIAGINVKHLLYMRAQEIQFNGWRHKMTPIMRIASMLFKLIIWVNFHALELILSVQLGLKKWGMVPSEKIEDIVSCGIPSVTDGLFRNFESGRIKPVLSTLEKYKISNCTGGDCQTENPSMKNVFLSNGDKLEVDTVIQATGWTMNLPMFPQVLQNKLVDKKDGLYHLYCFAVNPNLSNIGFVGFNSSFCSVLTSELIANWVVRYADKMLVHQPSQEVMDHRIKQLLNWKRQEHPAAMVYGGNCVAPFHYLHFDEILDDMGATRTLGYCQSMFSYPDADKLGECLDSLPKYSVH